MINYADKNFSDEELNFIFEIRKNLLDEFRPRQESICRRLNDFKQVSKQNYFYELAYCLCTPQSQAKNADKIQKILQASDFLNKPFDPSILLGSAEHYIRFHNNKSKYILTALENFDRINDVLESDSDSKEKRNKLRSFVKGFGMKEASHFLRNIGYENLAILDRHILKHLLECKVIDVIPKPLTDKIYKDIENKFFTFSEYIGIKQDELDLLFWSMETGEILK